MRTRWAPMTKKAHDEAHENRDEVPFEKLLERLAQVADGLEKSDVPLEKALSLFEEGVGLAKNAQERLAQAESRIEELVGKGQTRPLEEGAPKKR